MKNTILILLLAGHVIYAQVINTISFDRFSHYDKDDWISYGYSNNITSIDIGFEDIYFGTTGGGILRYNLFSNEWLNPLTTSNGLQSNNIIKIIYDNSTNELYAVTNHGVDVYNESFEYWQVSNDSLPERKTVEYSSDNNVLPAFSRPGIGQWPTFFPDNNYTLMSDGRIYNADNEEYMVKDRIVDNWDRLWIATNGTGIGIGNLNSLELNFIKQSIPAIRPKDVLVYGNDIWIGGEPFKIAERGITHWDYEKNIWTYYKSGINYNIFSDNITVIEKNKKYIFFGTKQGLLSFDIKEEVWKNLQKVFPIKDDTINDLYNWGDGLFVATENGVFIYNSQSNTAVQIAKKYINQTNVNSLARLRNKIYIATNYGIFEFNPADSSTRILKSKAAIADNFIDAVAGNNDTLWFAGQNGIGFYDMNKDQWKSFPALKYNLKSKINHIALTKGCAWFATNTGLLKYNIDRDYWYLYTTEDGLIDNRISRIETDGDYLWLSTYNGVTLFYWNREGRIE